MIITGSVYKKYKFSLALYQDDALEAKKNKKKVGIFHINIQDKR